MTVADRTRLGLGVLLSAGHRLTDILDLTFGQIEECIIAIEMVRVHRLDQMISPVMDAISGTRGTTVAADAPRRRAGRKGKPIGRTRNNGWDFQPYSAPTPADGEAVLRSGWAMLGIGFETKGSKGDSGTSGG